MTEELNSYEAILETFYIYYGNVYFQCRSKEHSKLDTVSSLPFSFDLPEDKCMNLDKLQKGRKIRYFWRPFTFNRKLRVEVLVNEEWIPIYIRKRR